MKIIARQTSDIIRAALDTNKFYNLNNVYNIELINNKYDYKYLLGILNSKLMVHIYQSIVPEKGRVFAEIKKVNLDKLPIHNLDSSNETTCDLSSRIIKLVGQMFEAQRSNNEKLIAYLDKQIDSAVYELYGLTRDDIAILEEEEN
jgi:hypothetical protein